MYTKIIFALLCALSTHITYCMHGMRTNKVRHTFKTTSINTTAQLNKLNKKEQTLKARRAARQKSQHALKQANRRTPTAHHSSTEDEHSSASDHHAHSQESEASHHWGASSSDAPRLRAPRAEQSCLATTGYAAAALAIAVIASPFTQRALRAFAQEMLGLQNPTD